MNATMAQLQGYAAAAGFTGTGLSIIVAIAEAESGGNTTATHNDGSSIDRGVLQINSKFHPEVSDACAFDPACSFQQAFRISNGGTSFTPWATFNNGAYKQFLSGTGTTASGIPTTTGNTSNPLTDWIASIQPLIAWLSQPVRIFKLVAGLLMIGISLFMLADPQAAQVEREALTTTSGGHAKNKEHEAQPKDVEPEA